MTDNPVRRGRLIYDREKQEICEVSAYKFNMETKDWEYKVTDGTHTEYEEVTQNELDRRFAVLPITVHQNRKSRYLLDFPKLVERLDRHTFYDLNPEHYNKKGDKNCDAEQA